MSKIKDIKRSCTFTVMNREFCAIKCGLVTLVLLIGAYLTISNLL